MSVFGLLSDFGALAKVHRFVEKPIIDNVVFRCHYRFTSTILFVFCGLCTANSLLGPPIDCLYGIKENRNFINAYCWVSSTFTLPSMLTALYKPGVHVAHAGVGTGVEDEAKKKFHYYYQWVPFVLFLQGVAFYVPHYFWKIIEDRKIKVITEGMRGFTVDTEVHRKQQQSKLVEYFLLTRYRNTWYTCGYYLCELLNFINVTAQIFITNLFLGGQFLKYGLEATLLPGQQDVSAVVFPRVTKCTIHRYGPSGTIQRDDHLCVLALNIINEKIYIFLWFWFIILAVMSGLAFVYSCCMVAFPEMRKLLLRYRFEFREPRRIADIVKNLKAEDFFLLHQLGQNINFTIFKEILDELSEELEGRKVL